MMAGVYIIVTSGAVLLKTIGPLPYGIAECQARIELWTKLYLAPPTLMPREQTYQCIESVAKKRRRT